MNCNLCPRKCNIIRTEKTGFCSASDTITIARADLHFWEEPCISGKNGSGTIFFCGCNLKCVYCQNRKISRSGNGKEISVSQLCDIIMELKNKNTHNINLVTPTHYADKINEALILAKKRGLDIPVIYNCGGYESLETIEMLNKNIDIYMPDFKYWDNSYAKKYSSCENYKETVTAAIEKMVKQVGKPQFDENGIMKKGIIVRHLALPYLEEDSKKILEYLYNTYKDDIYISIMNQYTPPKEIEIEELKYPVSKMQYNEIIDFGLELGIKNAFIQEEGTISESFIPDFNVF